ncbi:Protein SERAC1 [Colletotrichum tropicale]|nr:Protein SERAC1 [Colletotrichum tropicale]
MEKPSTDRPRETKPRASSEIESLIRIPEIKRQDLGLKVLYENQDADEIEVDIVAVHGIMADPNTTWTHKKTNTNWLCDSSMLPESLKGHKARIMSFGYDSRWFGKDSTRQSLHNLAEDFLYQLNQTRERPMVMIAHCFGGLIVQSAYNKSCMQAGDFPGVWQSMRGMMFLGTPHSGVNEGSSMSRQGEIYAAIAASKMEIQDNVLQSIMRDNDILESTRAEFTRKVSTSKPPPKIFCFFELRPTNLGAIVGAQLPKEFLVGESSATLSGHERQGLAVDHFYINKFEDKFDNHYRNVAYQILRMVKEAKMHSKDAMNASGGIPPPPSDGRFPVLPGLIGKRQNFAPRQRILERLEERLSKRGMAALCGNSGSGKTHVAVEYADRYLHQVDNNCQVFWINAASPEEFEASFKRIGAKLRVSPLGLSHDGYLSAVKEHLKHEEQWLLVLDGLNDDESLHSTNSNPGQEPKPLLSFLPKPSDNHRLLITTTQRTLANRQMSSKDKNVLSVSDLVKEDASRLLLGRVASSSTNVKRIEEIINIVGDSAGALELVRLCGIVTQTAVSSQLLDLLGKHCKGNENGESPKPAWNLFWTSLKARNSELAYGFHIIGLLDLQMIPSIFFSNNERKTLLEELTKLGLVEHSDGRSFYRVPAFFRQCLQSTITEKHQQDAEAALLQSANAKFVDDDRSILLPVALAALKLKAGRPDAKREQDILRKKVESYRQQHQTTLGPDIGYLHDDPRRLSTGYGWDQLRRSTFEGSFNQRTGLPNSHQRSISEDSSGWPSWQRLQRRLMDPEWEKKRETLRKDSSVAAQILSHGRPPKGSEDATSIYRRVIDSYSAEPEEYLKLASLQYNLAIAQGSEGMVDDAAATFRQALQTILSGDDPKTRNIEATKLYYRIYTDLASMYVSDGRFADAEETFMHFLPSQAKDLGQDSQQTLKTRHEFARLLQERGQSELGGQELERILKANERVLGSNHRDTLTVRCSFAAHLAKTGKKDEAIKMLLSVWREQEKALGSSHRETDATRQLLDELYQSQPVVA